MKGKLIIGLLALGLMTMSCKEDASKKIKDENLEIAKQRDDKIKLGGPKLVFEATEHDFGTINEGAVVEKVFTFKNEGKSELIITSAKGSCGCTVPEWPKEPIMPGEAGEIRVKFNSSGRLNLQQKQVTIETNTEQGKHLLKIKAQVNPVPKMNQNS